MKLSASVVLIYALITLFGGWMGHLRTGSTASLIAGVVSGIGLIVFAIGIFKKSSWGLYGALVLTFLLDAFFTYRFINNFKFLPSGMMSLLSFGVLLLLAMSRSRIKNYLKS